MATSPYSTGNYIMTKAENREIATAIRYSAAGLGPDYLARALSALYRSARSAKSQREILALAIAYGANQSAEFII
jgi:hypothetical protein